MNLALTVARIKADFSGSNDSTVSIGELPRTPEIKDILSYISTEAAQVRCKFTRMIICLT